MTIAKNSVGEQCSVSGFGVITLGTALAGCRKVSAAFADGDQLSIRAEEMDSDGLRGFPVAWENARGTYNAGADTITRGTVLESSNAGAAVSFGPGIKRVFVALFAQDLLTTVAAADISDASAAGRAVLTAANAAAQRTALGLATVATTGSYNDLGDIPLVTDTNVKYTAQSLTSPQKIQALTNQGVTITPANLNALDDGASTALHFHDADRARANHTGTQTLSTLSQSGATSSQVATWNGTAWAPAAPSGGGGSPGGSDGQVQYNNSGAFGGDPDFCWNSASGRLGINTPTPRGNMDIPGASTTAPQIIGGEFCLQTVAANNSFIFGNAYFNGGVRALATGPGAGFQFDSATIRFYSFGSAIAGDVMAVTNNGFCNAAGLTISEKVTAKILATNNYTLAALISAHPSPTFGDRSYISDASTATWTGGAAAVGGGSTGAPVNYNGAWVYG